MADLNYLTKETLAQMKEELSKLKTSGRAEIARQIAEAREKGDLKEMRSTMRRKRHRATTKQRLHIWSPRL